MYQMGTFTHENHLCLGHGLLIWEREIPPIYLLHLNNHSFANGKEVK